MTYYTGDLRCDSAGRMAVYLRGKWMRAEHSYTFNIAIDNISKTNDGEWLEAHYIDDFEPCEDRDNAHVKKLHEEIMEWGKKFMGGK